VGCGFHPRWPKAGSSCAAAEPGLDPAFDDGPAHRTACFFPLAVGEDLSAAVPELKAS
jgi:hypothetical protein